MLKLISNRSTWLQLLTVMFLLTTAWSCSLQEVEITEAQPTVAEFLVPPGEGGSVSNCYCPNACNTFDASYALLPVVPNNIPFSGAYEFAVNVMVQNPCDLSGLTDRRCALQRMDFILNLTGGLTLNHFEHIAVFDLLGNPIPYTTGTNNNSNCIVANKSFNACFILKSAYSDFNIQTEHFSAGGLCIIGIITDPDGSGGTGGTSPGDDNG